MAIDKKVKGIKIEIGYDTVGFEKGLKSINAESKRTQTELEQVNRLLKLDPKNTELLTQKQKLLAQGIEQTQVKVDALKKAKDEADKNMQNGTQINEQQYRKLQREIAASEMSIKSLEKQNESFGKTSHTASITASDGFQKVDKISGNVLKSIGALAVAVGGMSIKAAYAADDINTMSKVTGLSTEEIQKFQYASERIDVSLDTLTGSMSKLTKNMATASKGTGDAYEAFKALGVEFKNQDGTLKDKQVVFGEVIKKLGEMKNETQRDAYAMQLMGKSAQDLNPLILGGADALVKYGDEAEKAGLIMSQDTLDSANELADSFDELKATATGSMYKVGAEFSKSIKPIVDKLPDAANFLIKNKEAIGKIVVVVGSFAAVAKTATTSMKLFNAVSKANPYVLLATAITGVVTALGIIDSISKPVNKKFEEMKKAIDDQTTSWKDLEKEVDKATSEELYKVKNHEGLIKELDEICDSNGKVNQGYEDRAKFITGELNDAYGTEIQVVGGVVQKYKDVSVQLDKLIEKKKASIIFDAQEKKYSEAIKKRTEAEQRYSEAYTQYTESQELLNKIRSTSTENMTAKEIGQHNSLISKMQEATNKSKAELDKQKKNVLNYTQAISQYEQMSTEFSKGNYDKLNKMADEYSLNLQGNSEQDAKTLEGLYKQQNDVQAYYQKLFEQTGNQFYKKLVDECEDKKEMMFQKYSELGVESANGFANGLSTVNVGKTVSNIAIQLSKGLSGLNIGFSLTNGIGSSIPKFANGGVLTNGMGIVAEAGPELIQMINGKAVMTPLTNKSGGKPVGNNVTINLIGTGVTVQQVESIVKRNMGGAYN